MLVQHAGSTLLTRRPTLRVCVRMTHTYIYVVCVAHRHALWGAARCVAGIYVLAAAPTLHIGGPVLASVLLMMMMLLMAFLERHFRVVISRVIGIPGSPNTQT